MWLLIIFQEDSELCRERSESSHGENLVESVDLLTAALIEYEKTYPYTDAIVKPLAGSKKV